MMNRKQKLTRPRNGRMLSGVCAGLANFFGLDVSLVRIIYVFATIFTAFADVTHTSDRVFVSAVELM